MSDTPDFYSMSDEELANVDLSSLEANVGEEAEEDTEEVVDTPDETETEVATEAEEEEVPETEVVTEEEVDEDQETVTTDVVDDSELEANTNVPDNAAKDGTQEEVETKAAPEQKDTKQAKEESVPVAELEAFYKEITSEFKANGKMMSIKNPSDIKTLVQQGINYSKRMAELKPGMGVLRTLEQHDLMDPAKLSYLIDLHNKDPKAIAKLVKESGIEAYDLENEDTSDYVPTNKVQEESKFQEVVNELNDSPQFNGLMKTVASSWDIESQQFLINNPGVLRVLNDQLASGEFDKIVGAIDYERMLGRFKDVSYIEAYSTIETRIRAANADKQVEAPAKGKEEAVITAPRPKPAAATNNSKKRKVATPGSSSSAKEETFNPLQVSDEEIMKMANLHNLY